MLQMIEEELELGEPYNFVKWLWATWGLLGFWALSNDWQEYREPAV